MGLSYVVACNGWVFKMGTLVRSSNQACLSAASYLLEWAATIRFIGYVGTRFVITVALTSNVSGTDFLMYQVCNHKTVYLQHFIILI